MQIYNTNYWEAYDSYLSKKRVKASKIQREARRKKESGINKANVESRSYAKEIAKEMIFNPSVLEKRMQLLLDEHNIQYDFQRIFYIKDKLRRIKKFYIADFYISSSQTIIETDGAFHNNQIERDELRTADIQAHYPNIKIIRWRWHDFDSPSKVKVLLEKIR